MDTISRLILFMRRALGSHRGLKLAIRRTVFALGFKRFLENLTLDWVQAERASLAARYLRGRGLEIGAMHFPLRIPQTAQVRYIDRLSREQARTRYPELRELPLVEPHIIDDGFHLSSLPAESEDFVVANHVLEHAPDAFGALKNWARVLKPGGVLFITVPLAANSFDRGRSLTPLEHLLEDHRLVEAGEREKFARRNLEHYREWAAISIPNVAHDAGRSPPPMDAESVETRARGYAEMGEEIHFHTFSVESFRQIFSAFQRRFRPDLTLVDMVQRGGEVTGVLQRSDTAP